MASKGWKHAALGAIAILMGTNGFWLYTTIDSAITRSYQEVTAQECKQQTAQLEKIANHFVAGRPLEEIKPFLFSTAAADEIFPKPGEHLWWVGTVALKMKDEQTIEALTLSPYDR